MNFDPSDEQMLLCNLIERYARTNYDPMKRLNYLKSERGFSEKGWSTFAELGVLAFPFDEKLGGFGGSLLDLICVMETIGKEAVVEPVLQHIILAGKLLERCGEVQYPNPDLRAMIDGKKFLSLAHIEHSARYYIDSIATKFTAGRLHGRKTMVMGASYADSFIVSARDETNEFRMFYVNADSEGVVVRPYRLADGSIAGEVFLNKAAGDLLDISYENFELTINETRLATCAELVGLMDRLFQDTLEFLKTREQFGQKLGSFQVLQHRMADNYARLELSRSHLYRAAANPLDHDIGRLNLAAAKAFIAENALILGEEAIQMHGGIGTTNESIVGQVFKRIVLLSSLFGDSEWDLRNYCQAAASAA